MSHSRFGQNSLVLMRAIFLIGTLLEATHAHGEVAPLCTTGDYKIASQRLIAIACAESDVSTLSGSGQIYQSAATSFTPLPIDVIVTPYPGALEWLLVKLAQKDAATAALPLQAGKKYKIVLTLRKGMQLPDPSVPPTVIDIDVNNTVVVAPAISLSNKNTFEFVSHVAYGSAPRGACTLQMENFNGQLSNVGAQSCRAPAQISGEMTAEIIARDNISPENIGSLLLKLNDANKDVQLLPYAIPGLTDIFGSPIKIDSKSQLVPEKAPTTKDASSYYFNFNYAAGRGSKPGWVLDGKVSPPIGPLYHQFQFAPLATADVGQNQVSNITYTNLIDIGGSMSRMFQPGPILQGLLFHPVITYETDKQFDRDNLIVAPDFRLNFAGLYNTRHRRTLSKFSDELQTAEKLKIPWTKADSKPVLMGYLLDFHIGTELGGALIDTTVTSSAGHHTLNLPAYDIARIVPQAHGTLEVGRFTLDATGTPRYLTTVENSVVELSDHSLVLERLHGWKAIGVFTGAINIDAAGHFALTATYKDGFSPPTYKRVNTVQSGITLKY